MKLPLYLKVLLLLTLCLVAGVYFFDPAKEDALVVAKPSPLIKRHPPAVKDAPVEAEKRAAIADLFPVYRAVVEEKGVQVSGNKPFPLKAVGMWVSEGRRTLLLTDGTRNWLLCSRCQRPGFIHPGEFLTPEWKLQAINDDYLIIEWLSEHTQKRIALSDLKIK